jgi:HEAT repeat protein
VSERPDGVACPWEGTLPETMQEQTRVPDAVESFFRQLLLTYKGVTFYPASSTFPRESGDVAAELLRKVLAERPIVAMTVAKDRLLFEGAEILPGQAALSAMAVEFYNRGVAEARFRAGTTGLEIAAFLSVLLESPSAIIEAGGFESRLWEKDVTSIDVVEVSVQVLDEIACDDGMSMTADDVSRVMEDHLAGRPVERQVLVRTVSQADAMASYFTERMNPADSAEELRAFAHIAADQSANERQHALRAIADAMEQLDPAALRALVIEVVLPDAKTDDAMASLIRQFDVDDMCRMLVDELKEDRITRDGIARALRNLALVSFSERREVIDAAGAAMRAAGFEEPEVEALIEQAAPTRLTIEPSAAPVQESRPAEAIFQLMDYAPLATWSAEEDPALSALEQEARRGVGDGEVVAALVALVASQPDTERWAAVMAMVENSLSLLVTRGEFEIACDAVEVLKASAAAPGFSLMQRSRLSAALRLLAKPEDVGALTRALQLFEPESDTHRAAVRLLGLLSASAPGPLLDQLGVEPDMATRKVLVGVISEFAADNIVEIAKRVTDARWYLVRNVVGILGSTKNPAVLQYLTQTARHPDARVRRETIRAVAGIPDRVAVNLLVAALGDDNAQNVQLAARYLGTLKVSGATAALVQVAKGEGRGCRDAGSRIEAIEALSRIGSREALAVVSDLAGKRGVMKSRGAREVQVAAEAALADLTMQVA